MPCSTSWFRAVARPTGETYLWFSPLLIDSSRFAGFFKIRESNEKPDEPALFTLKFLVLGRKDNGTWRFRHLGEGSFTGAENEIDVVRLREGIDQMDLSGTDPL